MPSYLTSLAPSTETFPAAGGTTNVTFDASTGSNRLLAVCAVWRDSNITINGVTYNGVALTAAGTKVTQATGGPQPFSAQLWYLKGPASGSNTIAVTTSSGDVDSTAQIAAWVCTDAHQTTAPTGYTSGSGSGSAANIVSSLTVTSQSGDLVCVVHGTYNGSSNISATPSGYTERQDAANGSGLSLELGDASGAASVATSATWSNGAYNVGWIAMGFSIPAAATTRKIIIGPKP